MSTTKRINQKKVDQIGYQRGRWAIYLFLAIVVVCQLLPFYLAINASMKPQTDMSSTLMPRLHDIAWDNWTAAITDGQILHSVVNSVIVTVCTTLIVCVVGAAAAYPLARRATRFNKVISALILATMMVPPLSILVPLYTMLAIWVALTPTGALFWCWPPSTCRCRYSCIPRSSVRFPCPWMRLA